jgi:serine/threonine-protein kinase
MASVYAAADLHLGRRVAVKVIHPEHARTEMQRRRILQEATLGARLDHPNTMLVFDLGEEEGPHHERWIYLTMPLVTGGNLRHVLLDGPVAWRRAVDLGRQLLAGLAALHRAGALHRDVKPENCLMSRTDGREHLRLADLGLAKAAPGLLSLAPVSVSGALLGTHTYLSPEQARGLALDERSDLYSAAVMLFELLTSQPPFSGGYLELLNAHVSAEPPSPRVLAPLAGIPASIEAVVLRALEKDPADRYATAEQFAAALGAAASAEPLEDGVEGVCSTAHAGCEAAQASLAAWTRFEYELAHSEATRAARLNPAWSPLRLMMDGLADA